MLHRNGRPSRCPVRAAARRKSEKGLLRAAAGKGADADDREEGLFCVAGGTGSEQTARQYRLPASWWSFKLPCDAPRKTGSPGTDDEATDPSRNWWRLATIAGFVSFFQRFFRRITQHCPPPPSRARF